MATLGKGYTFGATEQVTAAKLHSLIDSATISGILAAEITDSTITDAKIASVSGSKLITLSGTPAGAGDIPKANLDGDWDTDGTLAANSDLKIPTQKAIKTFVNTSISSSGYIDRGDHSAHDFSVGDLTTNGAWHDLDLSSIVPAGAKAVLLMVGMSDDAANRIVVFRKNGNTNTFNMSSISNHVTNIPNYGDLIVPCDTNRIIEYLADNATFTSININVKGWFI